MLWIEGDNIRSSCGNIIYNISNVVNVNIFLQRVGGVARRECGQRGSDESGFR